jgi:hypothetical protein
LQTVFQKIIFCFSSLVMDSTLPWEKQKAGSVPPGLLHDAFCGSAGQFRLSV